MTLRLDKLIAQIREIQRPCMHGEKPADILVVCLFSFSDGHEANPQIAHGLVLRCFAKRWLGFAVNFPLQMLLSPGAVAILRYFYAVYFFAQTNKISYKNNNIEEPAFYLGLSLPCAQDVQPPEREGITSEEK